MWMFLWMLKTNKMVKVILTLTAAAGSVIGQIYADETKNVLKHEPVKKEIHEPFDRTEGNNKKQVLS